MERLLKRKTWLTHLVLPNTGIRWPIAAGLAFVIFTAMLPGMSAFSAWGQTLPGSNRPTDARIRQTKPQIFK